MKKNDDNIFSVAKGSGGWTKEQRGDLLLSLAALSQILLGIAQGVLIVFGMPEEMSTIFRVVASAVTMAISFPLLLRRKWLLVLIVYVIVFLIYCLHLLAFPETIEYWHKEALRFTLPISIPSALCIIAVRDRHVFYYVLKIMAYISGGLCLMYGYSVFTGRYDIGFSYNQGIGYSLLFPMLVLFYERKKYSIIFGVILLLILLLYGSRGPVLSLVLFGAYYLFTKKKYGLGLLAIVFLLFGAALLNSFFESQGLSSRTLELYTSGHIDIDNGRDVIDTQIERGIRARPTGWGLFGDRVITNGANNAHSLVKEVIAEFGVYLGPVVLFLFALKILTEMIKLKSGDKDMFALFLFACVAPVLVSGSYLTNTNFALFIGVMVLLHYKRISTKL